MAFSPLLWAQETEMITHPQSQYQKAVELYNRKLYQPAQNLFRKEQTSNPDRAIQTQSEYYVATIAAILNQDGADALVNNFIVNHPDSPLSSEAYLQMANIYYQQGNYEDALAWYEAIDDQSISSSDKAKYNFQKGFCLFQTGKQAESKPYFESVQNTKVLLRIYRLW